MFGAPNTDVNAEGGALPLLLLLLLSLMVIAAATDFLLFVFQSRSIRSVDCFFHLNAFGNFEEYLEININNKYLIYLFKVGI